MHMIKTDREFKIQVRPLRNNSKELYLFFLNELLQEKTEGP